MPQNYVVHDLIITVARIRIHYHQNDTIIIINDYSLFFFLLLLLFFYIVIYYDKANPYAPNHGAYSTRKIDIIINDYSLLLFFILLSTHMYQIVNKSPGKEKIINFRVDSSQIYELIQQIIIPTSITNCM